MSHKGPSGASVTYCNISCFFGFFPLFFLQCNKAKIVYNFGLSECNRVKISPKHSKYIFFGTPNFPFGTNGKLMVLGVPILKHFRV